MINLFLLLFMQGQPVIGMSDSWNFSGSDILTYRVERDTSKKTALKREAVVNQLAFLVQPPCGLAFTAMHEVHNVA